MFTVEEFLVKLLDDAGVRTSNSALLDKAKEFVIYDRIDTDLNYGSDSSQSATGYWLSTFMLSCYAVTSKESLFLAAEVVRLLMAAQYSNENVVSIDASGIASLPDIAGKRVHQFEIDVVHSL